MEARKRPPHRARRSGADDATTSAGRQSGRRERRSDLWRSAGRPRISPRQSAVRSRILPEQSGARPRTAPPQSVGRRQIADRRQTRPHPWRERPCACPRLCRAGRQPGWYMQPYLEQGRPPPPNPNSLCASRKSLLACFTGCRVCHHLARYPPTLRRVVQFRTHQQRMSGAMTGPPGRRSVT